ncbi:DUF86 domain-containing protein [Skermanella sp. TT6]|uniref:DUF86 domain-containing protein n=2 Tax=Skermanella cutis TaxID=2775420 RepID=A0ABX7B962_9PROT|nr:DUF86 domain-containing protein [Skermanella sp. TT6]
MPPEDRIRILHMIEAANTALRFVTGRRREDLDNDEMLLFALLRAVEVVGEAASRVSPETRAAAPAVPWASIVAMRNRLVHAYFDVDRNIVWRTVTEELPPLISLLDSLTENE